MRLTAHQVQVIRDTARGLFGQNARVTLFGSRVDDTKRGGDIDLMVEADHPLDKPWRLAARYQTQLQLQLGDQKIDVLVVDPATQREPIHDLARATGIPL